MSHRAPTREEAEQFARDGLLSVLRAHHANGWLATKAYEELVGIVVQHGSVEGRRRILQIIDVPSG